MKQEKRSLELSYRTFFFSIFVEKLHTLDESRIKSGEIHIFSGSVSIMVVLYRDIGFVSYKVVIGLDKRLSFVRKILDWDKLSSKIFDSSFATSILVDVESSLAWLLPTTLPFGSRWLSFFISFFFTIRHKAKAP